MNQQVNEDLVRAIVSVLQNSNLPDGSGSVSVDYDVETENEVCADCLQDRIDELKCEIKELQDEIAERDMYDLMCENEYLRDKVEQLEIENELHRQAFNDHVDSLIEFLESQKYDI